MPRYNLQIGDGIGKIIVKTTEARTAKDARTYFLRVVGRDIVNIHGVTVKRVWNEGVA